MPHMRYVNVNLMGCDFESYERKKSKIFKLENQKKTVDEVLRVLKFDFLGSFCRSKTEI